jgi:hypothetical protein
MMNVEQLVEFELAGETEVLCAPQIPHDLTRAPTLAAAVGGRQLTARVMARPFSCFFPSIQSYRWTLNDEALPFRVLEYF